MSKELELEMKFAKKSIDELDYDYWVSNLLNAGFEIVDNILDDSNLDTYFDTPDFHFLNNDKSVRIREKNNKGLVANLKNNFSKELNGTKRNEYKANVDNYNVVGLIEKFKVIDQQTRLLDKEPKLVIKNKRKTIIIKKYDVLVEFSIDDVKFIDPLSDIVIKDEGLEIEIKNQNKKTNIVATLLRNVVIKSGSYEDENFNNKYQKGLYLINKEKKIKRI